MSESKTALVNDSARCLPNSDFLGTGCERINVNPPLEQFLEQHQTRFKHTLQARRCLEACEDLSVAERLNLALRDFGLSPPKPCPAFIISNGQVKHLLDRQKVHVYSEYIRRSRCQLPEFVRLLCGETEQDPRTNKSLEIPRRHPAWPSYEHKYNWEEIVQHGVTPKWKAPFPKQTCPPKNHGSARRALNILVKNLRAGQDTNRYLILDIHLLNSLDELTCSPFGAVPKGDADLSEDARIIHDLSHPKGNSVNENTVEDEEISVTYDGAAALANRVLNVATTHPGKQRMMTGDVHGAFRHIPIAAEAVGRFAGTIPELGILVIDLYCPFGWCNSPSSYWVAGAAINHIYGNTSPVWIHQPSVGKATFDAKAWCDDHTAIEPDIGSRLPEANLALRTAMTTILGSSTCNEKKCSSWFRQGKALGLIWNLEDMTISIPPDKILKALNRVNEMASRKRTTRTNLNKLVDSLRHVVTCIRPAASFFQRVAEMARLSPRFGLSSIPEAVKEDLRWFELILKVAKLNAIPMTRFTNRSAPDYHMQMDASDRGLCMLFPVREQFIQLEFSSKQQLLIQEFNRTGNNEFGINVRELMSVVYASLVWGTAWKNLEAGVNSHVKFWIDNTSAVAWSNKRFSRNSFAQMLLRIISLCEVKHGFFATASHVAGVHNEMADAGSRVWQSPTLALTFSHLSSSWQQVQIPPDWHDISRLWELCCEQEL